MNQKLPASMIAMEITGHGGPEVLIPRKVAVPEVAEGELLVRVQAAGVNRPDVMQRMGQYPMPAGVNPTPGLEVAGEVAALGAGVLGFAKGDRVCALVNGGGYAEYCVVPATQALPIPANMDAIHAAAIPETFFTVWANLFNLAKATKDDCVLIHGGTSGIGTTALMLCRERGIRAFATAGSEVKCKAIRELGAEAINYREQDFVEVVHADTAGRGADIVLDIMGGSHFSKNLDVLAYRGRLVLIGVLGGVLAEVDLLAVMAKQALVTGSMMRPRTSAEKAAIAEALRQEVWPVLAQGRCHPVLDKIFPLVDAAEAHRRMEAGDHIGKIVLEVAR